MGHPRCHIATAVDAVKLGAVHYLAKLVEVEAILSALEDNEGPDFDVPASDEPLSVDRLEWEHIQRALNENDGNISATARALKMQLLTGRLDSLRCSANCPSDRSKADFDFWLLFRLTVAMGFLDM